MKSRKGLLLFSLIAGLILYSCKKGDTGPIGAAGATGSKGTTGGTGSQGPIGTSNVIASKWFRVDSSVWKHTAADSIISDVEGYSDTQIIYHAIVPTPLITTGIKDSGLVLFFYKDSTGNGDPTSITVQPYIAGLGIDVGVTNRPTQSYVYNFYSITDSLGSSFTLETKWDGWGGFFDTNSPDYGNAPYAITHEELAPKTNIYLRYIVISAVKTQRAIAPVDYKDYKAVLKYYHLEDK